MGSCCSSDDIDYGAVAAQKKDLPNTRSHGFPTANTPTNTNTAAATTTAATTSFDPERAFGTKAHNHHHPTNDSFASPAYEPQDNFHSHDDVNHESLTAPEAAAPVLEEPSAAPATATATSPASVAVRLVQTITSSAESTLQHLTSNQTHPTLTNIITDASALLSTKFKSVGGRHHFKNVFAAPLQPSENYRPPVFPKTPAERDFIIHALRQNFVFSNMSSKETQVLVEAFERQETPADAFIIKQDDPGDYFYILLHGDCRFLIDGRVVGRATRGQSFGELALLYTSPRAASVQAESNCTLFRVDQTTFRFILQTQTEQTENDKRDLVKGVPFFHDLDASDINKLVTTLRPKPFNAGEYLVRKGEMGDAFYLIQEGKVRVCDISVGTTTYQDQTLGPGEYFGEVALITHEPRKANCVALSNGIALVIDADTFSKVVGNYDRLILKSQDKRLLAGIKVIADSRLDSNDLASLANLIVDKKLPKGTKVLSVDQVSPATLYLVREGKVEIVTRNDRRIVEAGAYFGEEGLHADVGKANVMAHSDVPMVRPNYSATVTSDDGALLGCLTLDECRTVLDTTQLGKGIRKEYSSYVDTDIALNDLARHKILGAGTFGQVWLVSKTSSDGRTQRPFALKIQSKYELVQNQQARGVVQEKNIMAKLHHPFIIQLVQSYQDDVFVYMLLGLVQGGELFSLVHNTSGDGLAETPHAQFYAACIFEGLTYMHRRKILYRDLKPENVLISNQGYPVIVDLGFAKIVTSKTYTLCGTPLYIAPEVVLNRGHDKGADHWSFGVLVYEFITGATPFYKEGMDQITLFRAIVKGQFTFPPTAFKTGLPISPEVQDLIRHLLVTDPSRRIGSLARAEHDVYEHLWFANTSFERLRKREVKAPWIPPVKDPLDCSNFDDWDHLEDKSTFVYPRLSEKEQRIFEDF